jgi:hypothetical protein
MYVTYRLEFVMRRNDFVKGLRRFEGNIKFGLKESSYNKLDGLRIAVSHSCVNTVEFRYKELVRSLRLVLPVGQ